MHSLDEFRLGKSPDEVSTIRGGGFPSLGFKVIDLVTIAPKFSTLTNSGISVP